MSPEDFGRFWRKDEHFQLVPLFREPGKPGYQSRGPAPKNRAESELQRLLRISECSQTWDTWTILQTTSAVIVAIFTAILAWVGYLQRKTYEATLSANKDRDRAYINASPSPPIMSPVPNQGYIVQVEIKNYGETPATITALAVYHGPQLPSEPENPGAPDRTFSEHFLVRTQYFFHRVLWPKSLETTPYFLFGYIDYTTVFNESYRLVFARAYDPVATAFSFVSQSGYNYVRPRKKDEK